MAGSAADRLGRRRLFTIGLTAFSLGSLLCSLAPNTGSLIALRMLQALGGSMLTPVSLSIVRNTFTGPKERAQALGIWSGVFGLATACGPVVGGVLVSEVGWRSVFWVNVPIGLAMMAAARRYVPESRAPHPRRVDVPGQALMIVMLGSLTYAVIQGPSSGWVSPVIVAFFAVAFVVLAGFLFVSTLYLQQVHGESPLRAGLALLPATFVMALAAPVAGHITGRHGADPAGGERTAHRRGQLRAARPRAGHPVVGLVTTTARGRAAAKVAVAEEGL